MAFDMQRIVRPLKANWGLKILALLLATLTYHSIRGVTGYEVEYDAPVQVTVAQGVAVLNQSPMTVRVRFRGSREDLLRLNQQEIRLAVRPAAGDPDGSEKRLELTEQDVKGISGVRVVRIDPPAVSLTFDREEEATFPVAPPGLLGAPLVGKAEVEYAPHSVRIRGPRRRLHQLEKSGKNELTTEPVDVDGRVKSFTRQVRIIPPGDTWLSHIEPSEVTAKINITLKSGSRIWDKVPVQFLLKSGTGAIARADPAEVSVILEGRSEILDSLTGDSVRIFADCTGLGGSGSFELPLNVYHPNPADLIATIKPATVKVLLTAPGAP